MEFVRLLAMCMWPEPKPIFDHIERALESAMFFLGAFLSETEPIDAVVMAALAERKARLCLTPPNAATRAQETYV